MAIGRAISKASATQRAGRAGRTGPGRVLRLYSKGDYEGRAPLLVGVLRGASVFLTDLVRAIDLPVSMDFIAVSSYGSATRTSGVVRLVKDLDEDLTDRHVILVEDIVDTGLTLRYLRKNLGARGPASLEVATLLARHSADVSGQDVGYVGFEIPDDAFVIGYGLDLNQRIAAPRKEIVPYSHRRRLQHLTEDGDQLRFQFIGRRDHF